VEEGSAPFSIFFQKELTSHKNSSISGYLRYPSFSGSQFTKIVANTTTILCFYRRYLSLLAAIILVSYQHEVYHCLVKIQVTKSVRKSGKNAMVGRSAFVANGRYSADRSQKVMPNANIRNSRFLSALERFSLYLFFISVRFTVVRPLIYTFS
jgi:hypothetical protein